MSDRFTPLDVNAVPLCGLNLVEASAGTGKTWTITGLFARLLLEQDLRVEQILVLTFTKAATAELRQRLRLRLAELDQGFANGCSEDLFVRDQLARHPRSTWATLRARLIDALRNFDEAAIHTIHGFCQRVLSEQSFETGAPFALTVVPSETDLLQEAVFDVWRQEVAAASPLWAAFLLSRKATPEAWYKHLQQAFGKPYLQVIADPAEPTATLEARYLAAYASTRELWRTNRNALAEQLSGARQHLNQNTHKHERVMVWLAELDVFFSAAEPLLPLPPDAAKLTQSALAAAVKKGSVPIPGAIPAHSAWTAIEALLTAWQALERAFAVRLAARYAALLEQVERSAAARKARDGLLSYNDMLVRLAAAVEQPTVVAALQQRYPAALVDEFQDTDPIQFRIFSALYGNRTLPAFLVGDPKQAIYSFRGADVYSYLTGRSAAERRYTLNVNHRSVPELVAGVNALFHYREDQAAFVIPDIGYHAIYAAERTRPVLQLPEDAPLGLCFRVWDAGTWPPTKDEQRAWIATGVANLVSRWLAAGAAGAAFWETETGRRPVTAADIAVLVATHVQAEHLEAALQTAGVPCVRQGLESVFASPEARELLSLLLAWAEPRRTDALRGALCTELMGYDATTLAMLAERPPAWDELLDQFLAYREMWDHRGFMPMFSAWLAAHEVAARLVQFRDGERRLTNLRQLAELIHVESQARREPEQIVAWFRRLLKDPPTDHDAALLRLESDAQRVRLVTIHTSKGLEYPLVICPFLWDEEERKNQGPCLFHDAAQDFRASVDLRSEPPAIHREQAALERRAENVRKLYVALTRATHRCEIFWGDAAGAADSALAWLLGVERESDTPRKASKVSTLTPAETFVRANAEMASLARWTPAIDAPRLPADPPPALEALTWSRGSLASWRMTSYSALTRGQHLERPEHDWATGADPTLQNAGDAARFPCGATAGTVLHGILEHWDFRNTDGAALESLCAEWLEQHGLGTEWASGARALVERTLTQPLTDDGFRLASLAPTDLIKELEFTLSVAPLDLSAWAALFADPRFDLPEPFRAAWRSASTPPIEGYLKGFIDLVYCWQERFFIVDYKSNWLGESPADYEHDRLLAAMAAEHYDLQYLLYTVALHRYLRGRLANYDYARHFGGVYYLFLRGLDGRSRRGVFYDKPGSALIEALAASLGSPA